MRVEDLLARFLNRVVDYLPSLGAGLLLFGIGLVVAWFVKRLVIQLLVILRLHRLLRGMRWGKGLARVDVRLSLYGVLGNLCGFVVFLVFLNAAFAAMRLTVVSALVEKLVLLIPRALTALAIFGVGWLISSWAAQAVRRHLVRESFPGATLVAAYARAMLVLLFGAMALAELDLSQTVVIIGFTVVYITMGSLTVILTGFGGKEIFRKVSESSGEKRH
ncbi:MAG: hypothetical protein ABSH05_12935 [Bryobacteraceae bacterium]|jgi:hypothetical protein